MEDDGCAFQLMRSFVDGHVGGMLEAILIEAVQQADFQRSIAHKQLILICGCARCVGGAVQRVNFLLRRCLTTMWVAVQQPHFNMCRMRRFLVKLRFYQSAAGEDNWSGPNKDHKSISGYSWSKADSMDEMRMRVN